MKHFLLSLLVFILAINAQTQNLQTYPPILVEQAGNSISAPFAGGINYPMLSPIDLNFDGKEDLFIFDKSGNFVSTFLNVGTNGIADYQYAPQYASAFPSLRGWALLRDYNCDGKADIFTTGPIFNHVYVYTNTSSGGNVSFANNPIGPLVAGLSDTMFVADTDIPAIDDIDNDGDWDILSYDNQGFYVVYFENLSQDNHGNCNFLEFQINTKCWGHFKEDGLNNTITLNESCPSIIGNSNESPSSRHSGSTLATFDADGDGAKELLIGDISFDNLVYLHNGGTPTNANMDLYEYLFPSYDVPINLTTFPCAYFLDVDNDGKKDLLVASNSPSVGANFENILYYHNDGTNGSSLFAATSADFLQHEMIDCGTAARPVFIDINADGLKDIIVGNDRYKTSSTNDNSDLTYYQNIGTSTQAVFRLISRQYLNLATIFSSTPIGGCHPTFGDLDADGDDDLILGDSEGNVHWFENTTALGNPAQFVLKQQKMANIDIGAMAMPALADISGDGKLDLIIGEQMGNLNYFENIGTSTLPSFATAATTTALGNIDVHPLCCSGYAAPFLFQNSNHLWELVVGTEDGVFWHYNNIDNNLGGSFTLLSQNFGNLKEAGRCSIAAADIDNDGLLEWITGNLRGGLGLFTSQISVSTEKTASFSSFQLYPNPVNKQLHLTFSPQSTQCKILIVNLLGEEIYEKTLLPNIAEMTIDTQFFASGLYFVRVGEGSLPQKFWKD